MGHLSLKNFSIRRQLLYAFGGVILVGTGLGVGISYVLGEGRKATDTAAKVARANHELVDPATNKVRELTFITENLESQLLVYLYKERAHPEKITELVQELDKQSAQMEKSAQEFDLPVLAANHQNTQQQLKDFQNLVFSVRPEMAKNIGVFSADYEQLTKLAAAGNWNGATMSADQKALPGLERMESYLDGVQGKLLATQTAVAEQVQSAIAQAQKQEDRAIGMLLGATWLIIVFSVAFATALIRRIGSPIENLLAAAGDIAQGHFNRQLPVDRQDEIGHLAAALNSMSAQLADSYHLVEEKVEQRTKELSEEQARLQASINSLSLGFIMTDSSDQIIILNQAAKLILSGKQELDESASSANWHSIDYVQGLLGSSIDLKQKIVQCRTDHKPLDIPEQAVGTRFVHIFLAPIIGQNNEDLGSVLILEDVTEAKALQRSRDEFFSIASHELRTPLTAIRGNTSLILQYYNKALEDPSLHQMVRDIQESSLRLIGIVNDFLDTSRLEQKRMVLKKESVKLSELVASIIKEFATLSNNNQVKMVLDAEPGLPPVLADADRTNQVLVNLIGNALKFTATGTITIRLKREGGFVHVTVTDTGKGIPADLQHLLFHKFQQAGDNILTRDASNSTGLGLYISKLLVEGMGGQIALEHSQPNEGSTFGFTLPAAIEEKA